MKTLKETIKEEAENLGMTNFKIAEDCGILAIYNEDSRLEKYQILPENEAANVLEDFRNYDGFKAANFEFEGVTYFFVKQ
jgi:hypothetical protein